MAIKASNLDTKRTGNSADKKKKPITDVKLQQSLQSAGYNPGNSSKETADAIMKYQKNNGLPMTGLADKATTTVLYGNEKANPNNAVSKLPTVQQPAVKPKADVPTVNTPPAQNSSGGTQSTKPATSTTTTQSTTTAATQPAKEVKPFTYEDFSYGDFSYADYSQSDAVRQANALLQQQNAKKPGDYQSLWSDQIDDYMNRIQNRDPFSYDFNTDALYQQYKDNYIQQGEMAKMDTMGQAAAMTGGYGNSYAQNVGQQAYNQQLSQLNNVMLELYQMAYDRYANEGQQLQDMYNMYMGREEQDYGRYMDSLNAWQAERDYLANRHDTERDFDYNKYQQDRALAYDEFAADLNLAYDQWSADREMAYNDYWNTINMDYQKQRDAVSDAQWQAEFNRKSSSGSGGGSSGPSYRQPSREDDAYYAKLFGSQASIDDLDALAQRMEASGYDPNYIASFYNQYASGMTAGAPLPTDVPTVTPTNTTAWQEEQEKRRKQHNGGGGGLKSVVNRFTY
jgi:hypothetical protein